MSSSLPEGVSYSRIVEEVQHEIVPFEYELNWQCQHCELSLQGFLLVPNGRYEGLVRNAYNGIEIWNNKLPRHKERAIQLLEENFQRKVENHQKGH